ncbi:hypothetical protein J3Q64DRAFT_1733964 [Phycomyces blakesleeanus]|uniref:Uncharacterized protein n=1 Tax=Phycomyces blakesleeanus TaxID=4837 RepID=A0ABR3B1R1_PHYBL
MFLQSRLYILLILLLNFITKCRAPPIEQDYTIPSSGITVFSIVLTIVIGYLAHTLTVRPQKPFGKMDTNCFRLLLFIFPMSGVYMAIFAIYSRYCGDRLLGIDQFKIPLKKYEHRIRNKDITNFPSPPPLPPPSPPLPPSLQSFARISSIPSLSKETYGLEADQYVDKIKKVPSPDDWLSNTERLRDWLVDYMRTSQNIQFKKYDNAPYLAALLHTLGPEKARKVKHCIINNNLLLGFDSAKYTSSPGCVEQMTSNISVNGPGVNLRYQSSINVGLVRYMSIDLMNQLQTAHNVNSVPYTEALVTIVQLVYITIICIYANGDRWAKVPIFIYVAMSILQTVSLIFLHKQPTSPVNRMYLSDKDNRLGSFLHFILERCEFKHAQLPLDGDIFSDRGAVVPLLICIWADYSSHSTTESLILCGLCTPIKVHRWLVAFYFLVSFGCLISGTIIGYIPK